MISSEKTRSKALSRFASRVLLRTRSGTGVAVYSLPDGSRSFLCRPNAVAVARTLMHHVSFSAKCRTCKTDVATCTLEDGERVSTPCLCSDPFETRLLIHDGSDVFATPAISEDQFFDAVLLAVTRQAPFVLFGMVKGYVHSYWPIMGRNPDPDQWARFFLAAAEPDQSEDAPDDGPE